MSSGRVRRPGAGSRRRRSPLAGSWSEEATVTGPFAAVVDRRAGTGLLGRRRELAALDQVLARARGGRSAAMVLRGEAGAGKSALLDHAHAAAEGFGVARCWGVEAER